MILFLLLVVGSSLHASIEFTIIACSYNNERYCQKHLESIACQTYQHWSMIYINDCSLDRTGLIVEDFVHKKGLSQKVEIIHNCKRKGAMANMYAAIHSIDREKVVVCVDGDDYLSACNVLEKLAKVYEDKSVWVTYGNYRAEPVSVPSICKPFPEHILQNNLFRSHSWISSHPKTFYAGLFQKIKKKDLQISGKFPMVASDVAFMLPILEMASKGHIRFIDEVLYIYNHANPINDQRLKYAETMATEKKIRDKTRYEPLTNLK